MKRRDFLQFLGASGALALLPSCAQWSTTAQAGLPNLAPSYDDKLTFVDGLDYEIFLKWGDAINSKEKFGFNNDFVAFHPLAPNRGILWVNHEYVNPQFIKGFERTQESVDAEMKEVGGSLLEIRKVDEKWKLVPNSSYNRRLDANTPIPIAWDQPIKGSRMTKGTLGNCAGGYTPWGTFLTCEENYEHMWGERNSKGERTQKSWLKWEQFYDRPPEHYGWVVEIEPLTGRSKKLISLGRMAHEAAAVTRAKDGRIVAYTGDDATDEHFYKFISDSKNSLERGKLYVANLEKGEWMSLDINEQPILKRHFKNQTEVQVYVREAAKILGATPLARPEDIEFDPLTGHVIVALTNNKKRNNYHGSIVKFMETDGDHGSLTFTHDTFLAGGQDTGFAAPDNLLFDPQGNLWFTTDMAGQDVGKGQYEGFGNNGLFVFLRSGPNAGKVIRVANAPVDAELTGPCFSPDHKTLFLCVQHPGETGTPEKPTSRWPDGSNIAKPALVTVQGPLLDKIVKGEL